MGGEIGVLALLKKQLTPQKLLFNVLFWTFHWGLFAYGW
jgi:NADPH oxidase